MGNTLARTSELLAHAVAQESSAVTPKCSLLREEVYSRIRGWIVEGLLPADTRLRDLEIAEALGVSRTPVREAIRRLEDEGLVVAEASRWTPRRPAGHPAPRTGSTRSSGRSSGSRSAWRRAAGARSASRRCGPPTTRLAAALGAGDPRGASEADTSFHRQLVMAADNRELTALLDDLKSRLRRIEIAYFGGTSAGERSVEEHARVVEALAAGDLDRAQDEVERNWRESLARLQERQAGR